jgi:hypothetical protein
MEGQVKLMTKADKLFREHLRKIPSIVKTRSDTKIKERPWNPLFPNISEKKEHARFAIPKDTPLYTQRGWLGSAAAVLVTRLKSLHCGFGFDPSFINCIGCERDIRRTGLRHPFNDAALLLQRIQYHVKGGFPFLGL